MTFGECEKKSIRARSGGSSQDRECVEQKCQRLRNAKVDDSRGESTFIERGASRMVVGMERF